jgi:tetratricopeptide (TPR) repeat protein
LAALQRYAELSPNAHAGASAMAWVYQALGDTESVARQLARLKQAEREDPKLDLDIDVASVYFALDQVDRALDRLEHAVDNRSGSAVFVGANQLFRPFAHHPRFKALLDRIGVWN